MRFLDFFKWNLLTKNYFVYARKDNLNSNKDIPFKKSYLSLTRSGNTIYPIQPKIILKHKHFIDQHFFHADHVVIIRFPRTIETPCYLVNNTFEEILFIS